MSEDYISASKKRQEAWSIHLQNYESTSKVLVEKWEKIQQGHKKLKAKMMTLKEENGGSGVKDSDVLDINAGGLVIQVVRGTLTQKKGSVLAAMFSGRWENQLQRDQNGRIFLDVNPVCFRCLVDYLTECKNAPPEDEPDFPQTDLENQTVLNRLGESLGLVEQILEDESSILVDYDHIKALAQFFSEDEISGQLRLLFRGSRDGMNARSFHKKCDDEGPIIVLVKTTQGYIFGGYSGLEWRRSGDEVLSSSAFLFSLNCHASTNPTKLRQQDTWNDESLYFDPSYGPCFGSGHDLCRFGRTNTSHLGHTYELPNGWNSESFAGSNTFELSEVEVFSLDALKLAAIDPTFPFSETE